METSVVFSLFQIFLLFSSSSSALYCYSGFYSSYFSCRNLTVTKCSNQNQSCIVFHALKDLNLLNSTKVILKTGYTFQCSNLQVEDECVKIENQDLQKKIVEDNFFALNITYDVPEWPLSHVLHCEEDVCNTIDKLTHTCHIPAPRYVCLQGTCQNLENCNLSTNLCPNSSTDLVASSTPSTVPKTLTKVSTSIVSSKHIPTRQLLIITVTPTYPIFDHFSEKKVRLNGHERISRWVAEFSYSLAIFRRRTEDKNMILSDQTSPKLRWWILQHQRSISSILRLTWHGKEVSTRGLLWLWQLPKTESNLMSQLFKFTRAAQSSTQWTTSRTQNMDTTSYVIPMI